MRIISRIFTMGSVKAELLLSLFYRNLHWDEEVEAAAPYPLRMA